MKRGVHCRPHFLRARLMPQERGDGKTWAGHEMKKGAIGAPLFSILQLAMRPQASAYQRSGRDMPCFASVLSLSNNDDDDEAGLLLLVEMSSSMRLIS